MATTKSLSLTPIVDVQITLGAVSAPRNDFNLGLIIGSSTKAEPESGLVIPTTERIRIYTDLDDMLADGYTTDSPEYKAAQLMKSATPLSPNRIAIGCWDKTNSEAAVDAVRACRIANNEWYAFTVCGVESDDIKAVAAYTETAEPSSAYFYTVNTDDVLSSSGSGTDLFVFMKGKSYRRSFGQYCGQDDTSDAVAATMGYAMGNNTGLANSAYTLAYKTLPGVTTDNLTNTQVEYIKGNNGNIYINRGYYYNVLEQGTMADGTRFDELINLDMLSNNIQLNVMDLLYQSTKIPQTEAGMTQIMNVIGNACDEAVQIGFIAPGKWNGSPVLDLNTGDMLPNGYLIQSESIDDQQQTDRDAREAPPIYVSAKLAGAIEHVTIGVTVNR